jgi:hypothetical protein
MAQHKFLFRAAGAAAGLVLVVAGGPASAHDDHTAPGTPAAAVPDGAPVYLTADLKGSNEVPAANGPKVGDPDGRGHATVRVRGTEICFTLDWSKIDAPTQGHVHGAAAGTNGPVVAGLFAGTVPQPVTAAANCVPVGRPTC